ncbi:hypothetical protein KGP95_04040 [Burkholderia multivorans]|nr:hypothetical protein [Burkholderia multivorans]MCO8636515.1 hypothetical protein [Burkholderia multivorans]
MTVVGLASDATLDWLCDARREGAAPVRERRSPLYVFLIALFSLAPISRLTSRFVDESRFCFRPSTEHRATQRDRGGRADLHGRRKASAPQQCAGGGEAEPTRSLSRTGAAFLRCAAACDPGEGKPAPAKKEK